MIAWLLSKNSLFIAGGLLFGVLVGGAYLKITSYIDDHNELVDAYERQALELNQAVEVNQHNVEQIAHIKAEHAATLSQLQGQLDSEATTMTNMEDQISRLRLLAAREPEIRHVEINGQCPKPDSVVTTVLADPFGLPDPES